MLKWPSIRNRRENPAAEEPGAPVTEALELALLAGVRQGRRAEFDALYRLYHPRLWRFLVHMLRRGEQVEEVLNDTLLVVWQRADSFDGRSKLSTWVFGIAYRKALKALSRLDLPLEADVVNEPADPGPGPEQRLGLAQLRGRLAGALAELSVEHRAVVELCYFHDMAYAEIAEVVGCPPETVKTRMFYARRRLRLLLDDLAGPGQGEAS
ncbi:RNA polymerase sigma factor [Roseateles saccharophilus]|uniref:RNA polymerase sigma-70 factor (ECF subfamily) n=1 Tax=Roseateles saccharophilus TaxID=304 RepID=A0A4R3VDY9_ROSSA|nr:sigma-70 family RNA polymerase sigma factor [Roseateles saccharophilus]MDG0835547.1 sigma-70 family RNA polymerase sigma factor [Roseateles saccharophilus]TCV03577.1 RNA polymerase sigma-70 factor (ECF subfamily) [Roseateles saccharophilus]